MKLRILSPSHRMPYWVKSGCDEYMRRFSSPFSLTLCELPAEKRTSNTDIARLKIKEGKTILEAIRPNHLMIALDERGELWTTEQLGEHLKTWRNRTPGIDFVIGGADGLSSECLNHAEHCWSLSPLTLPHLLVRILLAEQLYRATMLLQNHPYHRPHS